MGEDKVLICRDCESHTRIDKLPLKLWEDMESDEWFQNEYRCNVAFKMMGFLSDHKGHNISLVGEYGRHQHEFFKASTHYDEEYDIF